MKVYYRGKYDEDLKGGKPLSAQDVQARPELIGQASVSYDDLKKEGKTAEWAMERISSIKGINLVPSNSRAPYTRDFAVFNVPSAVAVEEAL